MKPIDFEFTEYDIGFGGYLRVWLQDEQLIISHRNEPHEELIIERINASEAEWATFMATLDAINVWNWRSEYLYSELVDDGAGWSLKILTHGHAIDSKGRNAYPGEPDQFFHGVPVNWPQYESLRQAIALLIKKTDA